MQINWFTVIAQLFNFALLAWLMKRFLYAPILAAMDQREQQITAQLTAAKTQQDQAHAAHDELTRKTAAFDAQKQALLTAAEADAETQRQKLLAAGRQEADDQRAKQLKALQESQATQQADTARQTRQTVFALAKKALADLASASLEAQAVAVFVQRLQQLSRADRQPLLAAFQADKKPMQVQSAFALTDEQRAAIGTTLGGLLGAAPNLVFTTSPALISGISLNANGFRLAWDVADYLVALEKAAPVPAPTPSPVPNPEPHAVE
ncbi:F0F1 ATP synthase subunit B [Hymenobacter sp. UV11]|uniref:F0F1 ATP synthase subunit B family protein n=1 Tax=Hymenobacter sp. UV11 TaxID=1849735 RepID=UPI00105E08EA|nr:F0F1 ATP synthase subunit B [Hymenobacter sp. UV11]TDN38817.1 F0F1 ATP synthase subunit B [Hymenobacter sp. UV11]TFZ63808.1 F0F1 ATP synthase subunit B [Hymenobacter sp. UV11]